MQLIVGVLALNGNPVTTYLLNSFEDNWCSCLPPTKAPFRVAVRIGVSNSACSRTSTQLNLSMASSVNSCKIINLIICC